MNEPTEAAREWLEIPSAMPHYEDVERELIIAVQHIRDLLDEIDELRPLLADAMGLLHNHEQHEDWHWLDDYDDVCKRYDAQLSGNPGQFDKYNRGYNNGRAEERKAWEKTVKESLYPAAREIIQREERERIAKHFASYDVIEMRGADLAREILGVKP